MLFKKNLQIYLVNFLKIFFIIIILFLFLDATLGKYIFKKYIADDLVDIDVRELSKRDDTYDHTLTKNFNGIMGWGKKRYKFCTDNNGFRVNCKKTEKDLKNFDIGFIGDSFTEGTGLEYDRTFVGIIEKELPNKKIANLGLSSYSPAIYFTKIKKLLESGYKFNEIIVFIDISDLVDDTLCYKLNKKNIVLRKETFSTCYNNINAKKNKINNFFEHNFIFSNIIFKSILKKNPIEKEDIQNALNHSRSEWTYNYKKKNFNNLNFKEASSVSLGYMENLHSLLSSKSIKFSIAVYPWPGTLMFDKPENVHVKMWNNFCKKKCNKFYNFMPLFFDEVKSYNFYDSYKKIFIEGDIHFDDYGSEILAKEFLSEYKKN